MYQEPTRRLSDLSQRCHVRKFAEFSFHALSLRFNYEGFCEGLYSIAKPFAFAQFVASGGRFDGRVALGPAGEPPSGSPRRPTAGFRRLRWRAHLRQKRRNYPVHPHGRKATRLVAPLPRQPKIRNTSPRQPQLGVGGHHQPRPPIRLLGVANPGRGPSHALLEEAERVFEVEAPDVGAPEEIELRRRPSCPCHQSHKTLGSRRLSPRGRRSTSTRIGVPTTMGRGPRLPFAAWLQTLGCSSAHTLTRTDP